MALQHVSPPDTADGPPKDEGARLLDVRGLEVGYGHGAAALRGVSLHVGRGTAVAVLGANGAGKTTVIRAISGVLHAYKGAIRHGEVRFGGVDAAEAPGAHVLKAAGMAQVPEGRMVFAQLTVEENLSIGAREDASAEEVGEGLSRVLDFFPPLARRSGEKAGVLSGGEQQMLAIGRAMMSSPRLMLLDEVSLGLAPLITREIFERLAEIRQELGTAMLMVEQNAALALEFCDYAYSMETGRIVTEGPASELRNDPAVVELYLGGGGEQVVGKTRGHRRRWLS